MFSVCPLEEQLLELVVVVAQLPVRGGGVCMQASGALCSKRHGIAMAGCRLERRPCGHGCGAASSPPSLPSASRPALPPIYGSTGSSRRAPSQDAACPSSAPSESQPSASLCAGRPPLAMAPDDRPGSPPYELVYWPGFPGRGELIRLLFEEAGVRYLDTAVSAPDPVAVVGETLAAAGPGPAADHAPPLAPPVLRHGSLLLSQTAAILLYLGPRLGLAPAQGPGPVQLQAIVLTLLDGFVDELHDTHHPVSVSLAYEDQKPEAARKSAVYRSERLPKYLAYLERLLDAAKDRRSGPWLYGDSLTYADLVLFQVSPLSVTLPPPPWSPWPWPAAAERATQTRTLSMMDRGGMETTPAISPTPALLLHAADAPNSASTAPSMPFLEPWLPSGLRATTRPSSVSTRPSSSDPTSSATWPVPDASPTAWASGGTMTSSTLPSNHHSPSSPTPLPLPLFCSFSVPSNACRH